MSDERDKPAKLPKSKSSRASLSSAQSKKGPAKKSSKNKFVFFTSLVLIGSGVADLDGNLIIPP